MKEDNLDGLNACLTETINKKIVEICVDKIVTNYRQYIKYLDDIQNLPIPLDNPHYANKNNFTYNSDNLPR